MAFDPILIDGFDNYASGAQRWTIGTNFSCSSSFSRHSWGQGAQYGLAASPPAIELPSPGVQTIIIEGGWQLRERQAPTTIWMQVGKMDTLTRVHVSVALSQSRHPYIINAETGAILAGPTTGPEKVIEFNNWYWIQVKFHIDASAGTGILQVNGATWLSFTGANTRHSGASAAIIDLFQAGNTDTFWMDDIVIQDGSTGAFQGAGMAVIGKRPVSDGAATDFTPNTGTSPEAVDEITADDDTTYDASSTVGHRSTYIIDNITEVPGNSTVLGVQGAWRHRKTEPGTRAARHILRVSADEVQGPQRFPSETSYLTTIEACHVLQPDGASAWGDVDAFNALDVEIGQEITS